MPDDLTDEEALVAALLLGMEWESFTALGYPELGIYKDPGSVRYAKFMGFAASKYTAARIFLRYKLSAEKFEI